ncbi:conserved hypothetical protein [Methanococcus vannielii SB]|uniref:Flagellin n=1 Tax=Methanococcus vannielii (strain ATCC 35089 / DSM 1224 / JCM 13029 / OCM 148 / SB) TaxID=406327 RepID=A6URM5_METVS|nr:hypothetical protein [Methanococcus vannielii]ABR55147.1 conserved hypothetical protein [Methanococcus vannielii SB]
MYKLISAKKGQFSFDFILAVLFLLVVFAFMGQNVLNMAKNFRESEVAERGHSILDTFENYAITAYAKDVTINATFEPVGNLNYTIHISNKSIHVNSTTDIIFRPESSLTGNFVNITGSNVDDVSNSIPLNNVNISFGHFYVSKKLRVNIK